MKTSIETIPYTNLALIRRLHLVIWVRFFQYIIAVLLMNPLSVGLWWPFGTYIQ